MPRIKVVLSGCESPIDLQYQRLLLGAIHGRIGFNEWHDAERSLYSFSNIHGTFYDKGNNTLKTIEGKSHFYLSAFDKELLKRFIDGVNQNNTIFHVQGVSVVDIQRIDYVEGRDVFEVASPVFCKKKRGFQETDIHLTYQDLEATEFLTRSLWTKMSMVGIPHSELEYVSFQSNYSKAKIRLIEIKRVVKGDKTHVLRNKASLCPIVIEGSEQVKEFAWEVGVGNGTGVGFGCLR